MVVLEDRGSEEELVEEEGRRREQSAIDLKREEEGVFVQLGSLS